MRRIAATLGSRGFLLLVLLASTFTGLSPSGFASEIGSVATGVVAAAATLAAPALSVKSASYTSIKVSWSSVAGADGYRVYRATSATGSFTRIKSVTGATTYVDTGRKTGKRYYYKVRAYRLQGTAKVFGTYSRIRSARAVPSSPVLTLASTGYASIQASWTPVAGASGYRVYRASSSAGTYSYLGTITGATVYTNTGRATGRTYYYKVRAYHVEDENKVFGTYSRVGNARAVPGTVPELMLGRVSTTGVSAKWNAVAGATGYEVASATSSGGTYAVVGTVGETAYAHTGLAANQTHYYKVRAYHLEGSVRVYGEYSKVGSIALSTVWSRLAEGNVLQGGQAMTSPKGQYILEMQTDGNLVLRYRNSKRVLWATNTQGNAGAQLRQQDDGNLVIYSTSSKALWNSGTAGRTSARLDIQDDGNAVVTFQGGVKGLAKVNTSLNQNESLGTNEYIRSADWRYLLIMQGDGNLVMYDIGTSPSKALWATHTSGDNFAVMQGDGNLVVYRQGGAAQWSSKTNGNAGAWLAVQTDGNLVIYSGSAIWSRSGGNLQQDNPVFPVNLNAGSWYGLTYPGHEVFGQYQYSAIDLNLAGDADKGQPIYAIQDGVLTVGSNYVSIQHTKPLVLKNGTRISTWYSMYGHLARNTAIASGSTVAKGATIGWVSNAGADNNHLHFVIFRNWSTTDRASAISPYWLPGVYSANQALYADDQYGTRVDGGEAGLYNNRIFSAPPTQ